LPAALSADAPMRRSALRIAACTLLFELVEFARLEQQFFESAHL
jgi:hypothetical protein